MSPTRSEPCSVPAPHRQDPATRLGAAAARYLDALHHAAEHLADPEIVASEQAADSLLSGLAGGPLPWLPGIPDRIAANPNWGPSWTPDHTWSLNSPTRSTSMPKGRRPGRTLPCRPS